jgi:peptidyl-prolyl cis-trans isomerase D
MQIIQTIRDRAAITFVIIAVSLIGFLLMDATSTDNFSKSLTTGIGEVNGEKISKTAFDGRFNTAFEMAKQQSQGNAPNADMVRNQTWDQITNESIFFQEAEKLGLDYTGKELSAFLYSNDQGNPLMQDKSLIDQTTGKLDQSKVAAAITNIKKAKDDQLTSINDQVVNPQRISSVSGKYFALLNASAYYPSWMNTADSTEGETFATFNYAYIPYSEISDTTIKVTDAEIESYVSAHPKEFKQEAGRMVSYISLSQAPSAADSADTRQRILNLQNEFATTTSMASFIARNSVIPYDSSFTPKSKIQTSYIDSIVKKPVGSIYGPFIDGGAIILAKFLGSKSLPDSAKARHILIGTNDPQTGNAIMPDDVAKKLADSLLGVINKGGNFAQLVNQFSTDPGSKEKGGVYDYFAYGQMVPEFNDFCFNKAAGTRGVVKTNFGYHIIEAMGTKGNSPAYKVAYLAQDINASDATITKVSNDANTLAANKTVKDLDAFVAKNGFTKTSWPTAIKENDAAIGMFQDARQVVRWVFENKVGTISEPFNVGDNFIVAIVDKVLEKGTMSAEAARSQVESVLRNKKKAEIITKKLGTPASVEAAATAYNKTVASAGADSSVTFSAANIPNLGPEPAVIGAVFNKANQGKPSTPIVGETGVFVINVTGYANKTVDFFTAQTKAAERKNAIKNMIGNGWFMGLKDMASVTDNRSKYY